jgi:hypothetical protein
MICFSASGVFARDYVFSSAANDEIFNKFSTEAGSYDNALIVVVQTYDSAGRLQTVEDIKFTLTDIAANKTEELNVKTPYLNVIADYKDFKSKYDFATSNSKRYMLEDNPDTSYIVKVEADLKKGREINIFIIEDKKIISQQTGNSFPFLFAAACKTKYSEAIKDVDKSIDNSGLNDWKDYIGWRKIIKKRAK